MRKHIMSATAVMALATIPHIVVGCDPHPGGLKQATENGPGPAVSSRDEPASPTPDGLHFRVKKAAVRQEPVATSDRATLTYMLSGFEAAPSKNSLQALGLAGIEAMWALASDPEERPSLRARAVWALAQVRAGEYASKVEGLLRDDRSPEILRRAVLRHLPALDRKRAAVVLEEFSAHENEFLASAARKAMAKLNDETGAGAAGSVDRPRKRTKPLADDGS